MTDDEVVKYVLAQHYGYWDVDEEGQKLDYEHQPKDDRSRWRNHAAYLNMHSTWHEPWREHQANALEVVKNWRAS